MRNGVALMETHDLDLLKVRGGCKGTPGVLCTPIRHSLLIFTRSSSFCISQGDTSSLKGKSHGRLLFHTLAIFNVFHSLF